VLWGTLTTSPIPDRETRNKYTGKLQVLEFLRNVWWC
jgi:hypothetical protein